MASLLQALFVVALLARVAFSQESDSPSERNRWLQNFRAYPQEGIDPEFRLRAIDHLENMRKIEAQKRLTQSKQQSRALELSASTWTPIGPNSFNYYGTSTGRVSALAVDPRDPDVVYLGAAEGGVWKTADGGIHWTPLTDNQPALSIGSIALDPQNPDIIYVGTGEANFNYDTYGGAGMLKSTDAGATWTSNRAPVAGAIAALAVHPTTTGVLLAAGSGGIYRSQDAGLTWARTMPGSFGSAVVFDQGSGSIAYAALGYIYGATGGLNLGAVEGVFASTDTGRTWVAINGAGTNVLPISNAGRIELAIDPRDSNTLYAGLQGTSPFGASLGLFKTSDGGANWTKLTGDYCDTNCWYNNVLRVSPASHTTLFGGGSNPFASFDGGTTFKNFLVGTNNIVIHPDVHAIAFSADGHRVYIGSDGGVWSGQVLPEGVSWTSTNQTLALTQFSRGISLDPSDSSIAFGGSQDNGVLRRDSNGAWTYVACGDAGSTVVDPFNPFSVYVTCNGMDVQRSMLSGKSGTFHAATSGLDSREGAPFVAFMTGDPQTIGTLYFGGNNHVWQTTDGAATWRAISPDLTGGKAAICSIAVAPGDANTVYAGTCDGRAFVTRAARGAAPAGWNQISTGLPNRTISQIAIDPLSPATAYLTVTGTGTGHVWKTVNFGSTWSNISAALPDIPASDLVIDPVSFGSLYVATDVGVYFSPDGGASWGTLVQGLPRVAVTGLRFHAPSGILRAATHGRGIWDLQLHSASVTNYSVSGKVTTADGKALANTLITVTGGAINPVTTDGNGGYLLSRLAGGVSYTVMAALNGYSFSPPSVSIPNLAANQTINFIGIENSFSKSFAEPAGAPYLTVNFALGCPGYYTAVIGLQPGARDGIWGAQIDLTGGQRFLQGGLNLGGGFAANGGSPGFAAFNLVGSGKTPQNVTIHVQAQPLPGASAANLGLALQLLDASRNSVFPLLRTGTLATITASLTPGFYVLSIQSTAGSGAGAFQLSLGGATFQGGVVVGGYLASGSAPGFAGFCISEPQTVSIAVYSSYLYGAAGAGAVSLQLNDAAGLPYWVPSPSPSTSLPKSLLRVNALLQIGTPN